MGTDQNPTESTQFGGQGHPIHRRQAETACPYGPVFPKITRQRVMLPIGGADVGDFGGAPAGGLFEPWAGLWAKRCRDISQRLEPGLGRFWAAWRASRSVRACRYLSSPRRACPTPGGPVWKPKCFSSGMHNIRQWTL